ncbi:MAG: hypothetical protein RL007_472 [Bacteroidota bacterium]|jgi:hypothetical protein
MRLIFFLLLCFPCLISAQISPYNFKADSTGATSVCVKTTSSARVYFEIFRWNKWVKIDSASIKESADTCLQKTLRLHSGQNAIRIRVADPNTWKTTALSEIVRVNNGKETERCVFARVCGPSDSLHLTTITMWEIYDSQGNKVRTGISKSIPLLGLTKGGYYLNYDNKTAEFFVGE